MKKILAAALALVLMLAVMVPAAADIVYDKGAIAGNPAEVQIKTSDKKVDDEGNEYDARSYTVSIPADQTIPWNGATETDPFVVDYDVQTQLAYGESITVDVAGEKGYMAYAPEAGVELKLPYYLTGEGVSYTTAAPTVDVDGLALEIKVTDDDWNAAVIGEYADNLVFTVTFNPAA